MDQIWKDRATFSTLLSVLPALTIVNCLVTVNIAMYRIKNEDMGGPRMSWLVMLQYLYSDSLLAFQKNLKVGLKNQNRFRLSF